MTSQKWSKHQKTRSNLHLPNILFGSQRHPRCRRKSLAPRVYRISISQTLKTRGLGHLQNSKDSLVPKVNMLKNVEQLRRNSKVSRPRTPVSWAIAMQQIQGAKLPATQERLPNVQSGQSDNFSTKILRIQAAPAARRLFATTGPKISPSVGSTTVTASTDYSARRHLWSQQSRYSFGN